MTRHSPKLAKSRLPSDFCQNRSQSKSLSMTPPSYSFHNSTLSFTNPLMLFVQDQRKAVQLLKRFKCRIIGELSNWKLRWLVVSQTKTGKPKLTNQNWQTKTKTLQKTFKFWRIWRFHPTIWPSFDRELESEVLDLICLFLFRWVWPALPSCCIGLQGIHL